MDCTKFIRVIISEKVHSKGSAMIHEFREDVEEGTSDDGKSASTPAHTNIKHWSAWLRRELLGFWNIICLYPIQHYLGPNPRAKGIQPNEAELHLD